MQPAGARYQADGRFPGASGAPASVGLAVRPVWSGAEYAAAVALVGLILLAFVGVHPLSPRAAGSGDSDAVRQVAFMAAFGLAIAAALARRGIDVARTVPAGIVLLLSWCLLTAIWSIEPAITVRRAGLLVIGTVAMFACVDVLGGARSLRILRLCLATIIVADWAAILLSPYAVHLPSDPDPNIAGSFRGLHQHKNEAGPVMGIAVLLFLFEAIRRRSRGDLVLLFAALAFLVLTRSKASLGCLVIGGTVAFIYYRTWNRPELRRMWVVLLGVAMVGGVALLSIEYEGLARLLSDRMILTGRGEIWHIVVSVIRERPFVGYGFGAVWDIGSSSPIVAATHTWVSRVYSAHNGYLETTATIGVVGLAIAVVATILIPFVRLLAPARSAPHTRALLVGWLVFAIVNNLVESTLLATGTALWTAHLFVLAILQAERRSPRSPQ